MSKLFLYSLMGIAASMVITACMDDKGIEGPAGHLMMVNAASGLENGLEIQLNGIKANISDVPYTGSTGYLTVNNGNYDLVINESDIDAIYHNPKFEIRSGKSYSLLVFGSDSIRGVQVEDNLSQAPENQAQIRFFNFTENTPMLNLSASTEISLSPIFQNRSKETLASAAEHAAFIRIDEGTYSLRLVSSEGAETILNPTEIAFENGKSYTLFATGTAGSTDRPLKLTFVANIP